MIEQVMVGAKPLTLEDLVAVARYGAQVQITPEATEAMTASLHWVDSALAVHGDDPVGHLEPIYSINTGFGSLAGRQAFQQPELASELSRRLIISNASGVGRWLDPEVVRAAMLVRIASLTRGYSGVRPVLVQTLAAMLNAGVLPAVPEFGSLGASGDLIPLAHLAIVATRPRGDADPEEESGEAWVDGRIVSGVAAMRSAGIERTRRAGTKGRSPRRPTCARCWPAASSSTAARRPTRAGSRRRTPTRCGVCRRCTGPSGRPSRSAAASWSARSTPPRTIR